jgi:hypothetical protein
MTRISATWMKFYKKAFPALWFAFLVFFVGAAVGSGAIDEGQWVFLVAPCFLAAVGFFIFKHLLWDFVDEVHDCGDYLLVKNKGEEEMIPLHNIMNVSASEHTRPPRITLRLVTPGRFGSEVTFTPVAKFTLNPFAKNPIAEDLIVRVDKARARRAY